MHATKHALSTAGVANPHAAYDVYRALLTSPHATDVTLDGYPALHRDPTYGFPGMRDYEMGRLRELVKVGRLTEEEVAAYDAELDDAASKGDWIETGTLFEIGFIRK